MANYNTFVVVDCKSRKSILITSSARKANRHLATGFRIEVWNNNNCIETIYERDRKQEQSPLAPYIEREREYIREKQQRAEARNKRRRERLNGTAAQRN